MKKIPKGKVKSEHKKALKQQRKKEKREKKQDRMNKLGRYIK
jgi:hypothetical protein